MMTSHREQVINLLKNLALFEDVPEPDIDSIATRCVISQYEKDAVVFEQGDPCLRMWFVLSGRVKIVFQDVDGREMILEMIQAGEPFGGTVLFFPSQPATARTAEICRIGSLSVEDYIDVITKHPGVAIKLLKMVGKRHHSMIHTQTMLGERVERRIAHILLKLADRCGIPDSDGTLITLALPRQDLADMAGTTLETAIRVMSRFAREGLIHTDRGGYIVIYDRVRLAGIAQSN